MRNSIRGVLTALVAVASIISTSASAGADVTGDSTITTIAGTGAGAFSGDGGPATVAQINQPRDTEYGPDGTLYIVDTYNHRVRAIAPDGTISTVAGNGSTTYNGDGIRATRASLYWPHDLFFDDASGVLYIADSQHHRIRSVTPDGIIHTVAGTGVIGSTGDGGQATQARLKNPKTVFVFGGWLYTAGLDNKVRRVNLATGIIETYAGTGVAGFANGSCAQAQFSSPQRLQVDSVGNVYVADTLNHRIRRIDALRCRVTTVAGTGVAGLGFSLRLRHLVCAQLASGNRAGWRHGAVHRRLQQSPHPSPGSHHWSAKGRSRAGQGVCRRRGARQTGEVQPTSGTEHQLRRRPDHRRHVQLPPPAGRVGLAA